MTSLQSKFSTSVPHQTSGIETDASACDAVDVTTIDYQDHQEYHHSEEHSDSITSLDANDTEVSEETIKVQSILRQLLEK